MPSTVAALAATAAIVRLRASACRICSLDSSATYQRVENPAHTVAMREALNEYTIIEMMGTYSSA